MDIWRERACLVWRVVLILGVSLGNLTLEQVRQQQEDTQIANNLSPSWQIWIASPGFQALHHPPSPDLISHEVYQEGNGP